MPVSNPPRRLLLIMLAGLASAGVPAIGNAASRGDTRESWDRWRLVHPRDRSGGKRSTFKEPRQRSRHKR